MFSTIRDGTTQSRISVDTPADGDAIAQWSYAYLNARVSCQILVKLHYMLPHLFLVLPINQLFNQVFRQSNCSMPESIIIDHHPTNLQQLHQPLMVVLIIPLVSINECEVQTPFIFMLQHMGQINSH